MADPLEPIIREKMYATEEIRSHSSVLTNLRMDIVFTLIDRRKLNAWDNPVLDNIKFYFSALYTLYDSIWPIFNETENKEINRLFNEYLHLYFALAENKNRNIKSMYQMLYLLDTLNRYTKGALQTRSYFFKMGTPDVKGIERSYDVIKAGGGLFGFKPTV